MTSDPLVGQTRLSKPEQILPKVLAKIRQVADDNQRGRLLTALAGLMSSEEALEMVENMLDASEDELLDTPYLRRIREQGREAGLREGKEVGLAEGKEVGLAEGKEVGLAEGKEAGILEGLREAILEAITVRFDPVASEYRWVSQQLARVNDREGLQALLSVAIQVENMADFKAQLTRETSA